MLFDIDWQGTQQLAEKMPNDLVRVFILPPDGKTLEARLKSRAQDSAEEVARRMAKAADEISHWAEYDYIIINVDIDESAPAIAGDPDGGAAEARAAARAWPVRSGIVQSL